MSDLGAIVKTAADDMAEGGEKAGAAIAEHFEGIGSELENSVTRYRGAESDIEHSFTSITKDGAQDAERISGDAGRAAETTTQEATSEAPAVTDPFRAEAGQAGSKAESLSAEGEQQAIADGHVDGEGGETEDPIDLVTGEMFLPQRDVVLPGTLPLVFERRHGSGYRHGRCFGSTWSSTLDQRVEIDEDGIHFATADGRVLHYPVPTVHGQRVVPSRGPRWPLAWNRKDDVVTIEQGDAGTTLHFPPGPIPQICRPLAAVTDRAGNRITFVYSPEGVPTDVYRSGGYHLVLDAIETRGGVRISALKLAAPDGGREIMVRRFRYDLAGRLTDVVNASGRALVFEYDRAERITQWTDRNGYSYRYFYRPDGRVERAQGDDGYLDVHLDYDFQARTTTVTDALGYATVHHWNDQLQTVRVVDVLGHETVTEYNRYGQLIAHTDPLGRTTRIERNRLGDAVRFEQADGSSVTLAYGGNQLPLSVTGPDGASWSYAYDERGLTNAVTDPAGAVVRMNRGARGELVELVDPLGAATGYGCDAAGLVVEVTDPLGAVSRVRRDAFGRITEIIDALGAVTAMQWDTDGRLLARTYPDGSAERWEYDPEGNLLAYTSAAGAHTTYEYGPFDLPTRRIDPDGTGYTFDYDAQLRLTTVTNPAGATWEYTYDGAGQLIAETDFDGASTTYEHDAAGQLITRANAAGQQITYTRDVLGRVVERRTGHNTYRYGYDAAGQLTTAHGPGSELAYTRDARGRVLTETVNGRTVSSGYDAAGNRTSRRTPAGVLSQWSFDANGRPTALAAADGRLSFAYDQVGRETTRMLGQTASLTQSFDALGRLTGQALWSYDQLAAETPTDGAWRAVQSRTYTYRPDGLPTQLDDALHGIQQITLTPTGRVSTIDAAQWREAYAYDALGNLTHATSTIPGADPDAEGEHEAQGTRVIRAGRTHYTYDAAGRVTRRTRVTLSGRLKEWTYAWDADDHLVQVDTPDGRTWRYNYDPLGRRIGKQEFAPDATPGAATVFTWDGPRLAEQTSTSTDDRGTTLTWDYQPSSFIPVAQTRRDWAATAPQDEVDRAFHAIVTDLSGAPSELISSDGTVAWHTTRSLWGKAVTAPGSTAECPLGFPGQYHDDETGLAYNLNRYYDPDTAAYLSSDPLGLAPAPNPHGYVPNPNVYSDPLGLQNCAREDPTWSGRVDLGDVDELGRPTGISATIEKDMIGKGTPAASSIRPPGFRGGRPIGEDARGHLLGRQLGGSGDEARNLVTLYQNPVNTPVMSGFEGTVRKAVDAGETIEYKATPIYDGTQLIPRAVTLEATGSGGFHLHVSILNRKP